MPSVLTHDFFGRDAYAGVARELGFSTTDEMDAFLLGNQGPDPLFYLVGNPLFDKQSRVGEIMHDEKPTEILLAMRTAIEHLDGDERRFARAYAVKQDPFIPGGGGDPRHLFIAFHVVTDGQLVQLAV